MEAVVNRPPVYVKRVGREHAERRLMLELEAAIVRERESTADAGWEYRKAPPEVRIMEFAELPAHGGIFDAELPSTGTPLICRRIDIKRIAVRLDPVYLHPLDAVGNGELYRLDTASLVWGTQPPLTWDEARALSAEASLARDPYRHALADAGDVRDVAREAWLDLLTRFCRPVPMVWTLDLAAGFDDERKVVYVQRGCRELANRVISGEVKL